MRETGIVSGYWNPLHGGHLEYIEAAKSRCNYLVAIVNNDYQIELKGSRKFMDENHRFRIMGALKSVDCVFLSIDKDKSVCETIKCVKKMFHDDDLYFFNSGDRVDSNLDNAEIKLCKELMIKYIVIPLPKIYSSSKLLEEVIKNG